MQELRRQAQKCAQSAQELDPQNNQQEEQYPRLKMLTYEGKGGKRGPTHKGNKRRYKKFQNQPKYSPRLLFLCRRRLQILS